MKRIDRVALAALTSALGFAPGAAFAQLPSPDGSAMLGPGTYRQVDPTNARVMKVGNTVKVTRTATGGLRYSLEAIRALDMNTGEISGTLAAAHTATSTDPESKCRLYFTANASGLVISQDLPYGDCGFGYGVVASGIYTRVSR